MTKTSYINAAISALELLTKEDIKHTPISNSLIGAALDSLNKAREVEENTISFNACGLCDIITSISDSIPEEVAFTIAERIIDGTFKREKIWEIGRYVTVFDEFKHWVRVCNFNAELVAFGLSKGIEIDLDSCWSELDEDDMKEFIRSVAEKTTESEFYGVVHTSDTEDCIYIWAVSKDLLNN